MVGDDASGLPRFAITTHHVEEEVGDLMFRTARMVGVSKQILWITLNSKSDYFTLSVEDGKKCLMLFQHSKLNIKQLDAIRSGDNKVVVVAIFVKDGGAELVVKLLRLGAGKCHGKNRVFECSLERFWY